MSTTHRPTIVGLVSPGLIWLAASVAHGQGSNPKPQGLPAVPAPISGSAARPASASAPASTAAAPAGAMTYAVLLLNNGTVIRGEIVDDPLGGVYRLKTSGGSIPYPKSSARRVGHSLDDLYRYQVAALPVGDPEERMKLVRWCLTEHLPAEAREQLAEVLQLCPDDVEAKRMALNLDATTENTTRDLAVRQTGGELPNAPGEVPNDLPPAISKKLKHGFNNALPEIFDLPPAQAVRRATEFTEHVQIILQKNCTGCHNEKYPGNFQLAEVRTLRDLRNPDVARANLDAALRLVNPDDLKRSDLLSAGLVPHGSSKNPIFRGVNDPQYQRLSAWVQSLRPTGGPGGAAARPTPANHFGGAGRDDGVAPTSYAPGAAGGFGSERSGREEGSTSYGVDRSGDRLPPFTPPGARRTVNEYNESADFSRGRANDFPIPFSVGGVEFEKRPAAASAPAPSPARQSTPRTAPAPVSSSAGPGVRPNPPPIVAAGEELEPEATGPVVAPTTAIQVAPGAVAVDINEDFANLPGMNQPKYPNLKKAAPAAGEAGEPAEPKPAASQLRAPAGATPPKKKPQIDPAALEKLMRSRAGGP